MSKEMRELLMVMTFYEIDVTVVFQCCERGEPTKLS